MSKGCFDIFLDLHRNVKLNFEVVLKKIEIFMRQKSENPVLMKQTKQVFLKTCLLEDSDVRRAQFMSKLELE